MADELDAILAKNAEEESQRLERERLKNEADKRRVEMLNAFNDLRNLGRDDFHRETGEDPGIYELPGKIPPPPDSYWPWQASKIVEVCRALRGWEGELEEYSAATDLTDSQQVALTILQAGMDGDQDRIAKLLVDLTPGSELSEQTHVEYWRGIPHALADIDRAKWAPVKEEPAAPTDQQPEAMPKKRRAAYDRDHLFLEWYEKEDSDTFHKPAAIRDKWNAKSADDRKEISPRAHGKVTRETAYKAIQTAKKEPDKTSES